MKVMKKWQWMLLLAVVVCAALTAVAVFFERPKVDPVLVAANDMLPAEVMDFVLVDNELLLMDVGTEDKKQRELMNLSTGVRIPLTLQEGYVLPCAPAYRANPEAMLLTAMNQQLPAYYLGNDRYFWMGNIVVSCVVDKTNGVVQSGPSRATDSWMYTGVTPWGEMYSLSGFTGVEVYTMDSTHGSRFELDDHGRICGAYPLPDGFLIVSAHEGLYHSLTEQSQPEMKEYTYKVKLTFTDKQLKNESVIQLNGIPYYDRSFSCWQHPDTGTILLSPDGYTGALLITSDRELYALIGQTDALKLVPYEDTTEITDGLWAARSIHICGISDDGCYALVTWSDHGLYKLDLLTRTITQQMTQEELDALGIRWNHLFWPGGEYLNNDQGALYRLVDRSTLPAE